MIRNHFQISENSRFCDLYSFFKRHCRSDVYFIGGMLFYCGKFVQQNFFTRYNKLYFCNDVQGEAVIVDCSGQYIMPGFTDIHVHLREPGFEYKETIQTGTGAALCGGYTLLCSMPNLAPPPDCVESITKQLNIIADEAIVKVLPYACITKGQQGTELVNFSELAPLCFAFTDDGKGVQNKTLMLNAMAAAKAINRPIVAHCEVESLICGGVVHKGQYAERHNLPGISSESEYEMLRRDLQLAKETGVHYHVCHLSTAESVCLVRRAKAEGVWVTAETAPHYLVYCDDDLQSDGRFKMNPPLRSSSDRAALIEGLADGTIDIIATDHAPHTKQEKSQGLQGSAFGIVGLETAFSALYTHLVLQNKISLCRLVEAMSIKPRELFSIPYGIANGGNADFCIVSLNSEYIVDPEKFISMGHATPFEGERLSGKIMLTVAPQRV